MKKLFTVMVALGMTITLVACGNETEQTSTKSDQVSVAKSSSTTKKHVEATSTSEETVATSSVASSSSSATKKQTPVSTMASEKSAKLAKVLSSSSDRQTAEFTEQDARDMLFAHLGNQANNKQQDASVTTSQTNAVASLTATYLGDNTWKLSGTMNGQTVSYTVSPAGVQ